MSRIGEKYIEKLESLNGTDVEKNHIEADEILCDLLMELGYVEIVELFQDIPKWYA